jgi:1,4-alpha-glucan branching enzyme
MQPRHNNRSSVAARAIAPGPRTTGPVTPKPVDFFLNLPGAKSASVAGSFNGWDIKQTPLQKDSNGGWKTTVHLAPGRYEYRFVVDGAQWCSDPGAKESVPNEFGSTNSVVVV